MLKICNKLFTQWENNNVLYCHWKSNEHLMEGLDGDTDLDVYVYPKDQIKAELLLKENGYLKCNVQKGNRYPNVCEWIGFDSETGHLVHVHLHYQIITGTKYCKEYVFPIDDLIIETRIKDFNTNVYITDPNLEIIILYSRIALKSKNHSKITPDKDDEREIQYLKTRISLNTVNVICHKLLGEDGESFFNLLEHAVLDYKGWEEVYKIISRWLKPYRKFSKIKVLIRNRFYTIRELAIIVHNKLFESKWIQQKTFPNLNMSICFLGQDGSGKSTVTMELCSWLNWKIEASRFYLGSGDHYNGLFKRLISFGSFISHRKENKENHTPENKEKVSAPRNLIKKKSVKNMMASFVICLYYLKLARRAYKVVCKANDYMSKGGIALFDRFPQNQFNGISDGPRIEQYYNENGLNFWINIHLGKLEKKYFERIQNSQPKLVFKLLLSPEESIRRKPFEDIDIVRRKHEITKALAFPNAKTYVVDANQDYQEEILYIKRIIWDSLEKAQ